jgi:hypothetical protein
MRALKAKGIIEREINDIFDDGFLTGNAEVDIQKIEDISTVSEFLRPRRK